MIETYESVIIEIDLEALSAKFTFDPEKVAGMTAEQRKAQLDRATMLTARYLNQQKKARQEPSFTILNNWRRSYGK